MEFIKKIMPPKFYRYLYHKMVIMAMKFGNTEPYSSCVILMAMTTFFQLFFLLIIFSIPIKYDLTSIVFSNSNSQSINGTLKIILISLVFGYFHYLLFCYKGKNLEIMNEFKNETDKQTQIGIVYLFAYLLFSMFLLFFPIILEVFFNIRLVWWA